MTNPEGGIIDDLLVYRLGLDSYMLVVNASNIEKDWNWIQSQNTEGVESHNISDRTALLAVQGPEAQALLQNLTPVDLSSIPYYTFKRGELSGIPNVIFSATGYTGAGGFELYFENTYARKIWSLILEAGKTYGLEPAGLGARDTLRLEMGFCLYGNDIDDGTNPLEAGLGWITKLKKDFTASDQIRRWKEEGLKRRLVGFEMLGPSIPRSHYLIKSAGGETIGEVRSGTQSPSLKIGIGLGYVDTKYLETGKPLFIEVRGALQEAKIVKIPFLKK
jgi:aminomethyltransferase